MRKRLTDLTRGPDTMTKLIASGKTDVGRKRKGNEDALLVEPRHGILVVADGMGGHAAGEVASQMVVDLFRDFYIGPSADTNRYAPFQPTLQGPRDVVMMDMVLRWVNTTIYDTTKRNTDTHGMGSTAVALRLSEDGQKIAIGHVGDSRCYRIRHGLMTQLTEDHSVIQEYARRTGKSITELVAIGVNSNMITQACGLTQRVEPGVSLHDAVAGDTYILCSDGVNGELSDEEILKCVKSANGDVAKAVQDLVQAAVEAGGRDNTTAIVCKVV